MMPCVIVWSRPKGLPIANTFWPTRRSSEVPMSSGRIRVRSLARVMVSGSSCSTAMSLSASKPTMRAFAGSSSPVKVTVTSRAPLMTW